MTLQLSQGACDLGYKDVCRRCKERFTKYVNGVCLYCWVRLKDKREGKPRKTRYRRKFAYYDEMAKAKRLRHP